MLLPIRSSQTSISEFFSARYADAGFRLRELTKNALQILLWNMPPKVPDTSNPSAASEETSESEDTDDSISSASHPPNSK